MPDPSDAPLSAHPGIRTLAFSRPMLTSLAVQELEAVLRAEKSVEPVLIDCGQLSEVTPAGLTALLELGRSASGLRELGLAALSRPLLRAAIQSGLAERFAIYQTHEAGLRGLSRSE